MPIASPLLNHRCAYVDGAFVSSSSSAASSASSASSFDVCDPACGDVLATLPAYGEADTVAMIVAAEGALSATPSLPARAAFLRAIAAAHDDNASELARIITLENGKPLAEATAEVAYAAGFYRAAADATAHLGPRELGARPKNLRWTVHHRPAGVVGLITPWNFPLAMLAKKLSAAIAAGAPAVVKPAEKTPLSTLALFHLLDRLALPPGLVNLVFGDAPAIGMALSTHPAVRVISFTGSTAVGARLATQAAPHMKRLTLELGGNAPFIVFDDADLLLAADELMACKFRCAGQTCVSANRVYVHYDVVAAFTTMMRERVLALKTGPGLEAGTTIGPLIDAGAAQNVRRLVHSAVDAGAVVVVGGDGSDGSAELGAAFFPPTIVNNVQPTMALMREEIFGPVIAIASFTDEDDVVAAANSSDAGLAAYVFTADAARADRTAAALRFGHVAINTGTGPTPEAPFGGMKGSGYGREGGCEGVLEFVELQTIPSRF